MGAKNEASVIDRVFHMLSSVRFGLIMLMLLLVCCIIGMIIVQQNVQGFREYYESLTPSQRLLYSKLDFFDIYHSWYFTLLLAVTALNIILSSIDRFPTAWRYFRDPKLLASPQFIRAQMFSSTTQMNDSSERVAESVAKVWSGRGLRARINRDGDRITVFAQRNLWNRLGAYFVHVALLTIFVGGFLTSRYGVGGVMEIAPGQSINSFTKFATEIEGEQASNVQLPFTVECTDLQQQLIKPEAGLDVMNTIDWLSFVKIRDGATEEAALVHLNAPFDYRGYRFFQSSFEPRGNARQITVRFEPVGGGQPREVTIERNSTADVEGIGQIAYTNFYPDFTMIGGKPATQSDDYSNPVAELRITAPDGKERKALAFNNEMASQRPKTGNQQKESAWLLPDASLILKDFEKVATSHTLTVQYDPGRLPVYTGFVLLFISLCGVFFFSHQRVWAVIVPDGNSAKIFFGGNTNRNRPAFEGRFNSLVQSVIAGRSNR